MITRVNNFGVAHAADFPAAAQVSGGEAARSGTDTKAVAFVWLHDDLMAIHETAATLAQTTPGLDDKFRLPHNLTYGNVLPTARAFAGATDTQSGGKGAKAKGTTGISSNLQTAFQAVQGLDAIVHNKYRSDPVTLAEWATARHVEPTPRHAKPAPAPQTK